MKQILALAALAALATAHAAPAHMATEGYVDRAVSAAMNGLVTSAQVEPDPANPGRAKVATAAEAASYANFATVAGAIDWSGIQNPPAFATEDDLKGYFPMTGGNLEGDLRLVGDAAVQRMIFVGGWESSGVSIHNQGPHGNIVVGAGSGGGGTIAVEGETASIRKNGREVATEEYVTNALAAKADAADVYGRDEADARFYPASDGALWASWWSGDGFRVVVSNYDVSAAADGAEWKRLPAASFEYRPGGTGALVRVWSERTRWERHRAEAAAFSNAVDTALAGKAGLDWGRTTPTGFDAPEGFTWLDTPAVAVAGGLAWQRTVTGEGAVWLLCSNGMVADVGGATDGSFRVVDMATGEAAFEVVQGDRRTVGANCGGVYTWTAEDGKTHLRVVYNVVSDEPPTLHVAEELKANGATAWYDEGAEGCPARFAGWTGSSGAWTNALWRASAPAAGGTDSLFCFATYGTGGGTVVRNRAPVAMAKVVIGGVTYALGTATIDGHTVLTLTEAP